ncbi:hypothetical protein, partial [Pseudomonas sp. MPBC4-3]|uniref:hypothetical protein n=1 Tax=Pseudomonas sp. MPBC4-3 TaxID=2070619 RepID=UPI001C4809A8
SKITAFFQTKRGAGFGAGAQPNAGQARSPQQARSLPQASPLATKIARLPQKCGHPAGVLILNNQ